MTEHIKRLNIIPHQRNANSDWQDQVLVRMERNWNIHTLLVGIEIGTIILENSLTVYPKAEYMHNL